MSVSGKRGVGIPVILLHDAEGGIVTIELKNGYTYRGILDEAQDNMNCTMKVGSSTSTYESNGRLVHAPCYLILLVSLDRDVSCYYLAQLFICLCV